jgi:mono/diheme cytochrome c family protein
MGMFDMIRPEKVLYLRVCAMIAAVIANTQAMAADPQNGERLAHRWCEACHVVSATQRRLASDQAPPFATVAKMPRFGAAEIALYLLIPHPEMPDMNLTRTEAGDLAAFITTLK